MAESLEARVERVLGLLAQVRARGLTCFGAEAHGFELSPVASEARVAAFEAAHAIRLPEDYRAFLRLAGEAGAGPYYGLYGLERWDHFTTWIFDEVPKDVLARPCPLRPGRNTDVVGRDRDAYVGMMTLGTQGCSYMMQLIVSGELRGRVAYVDGDGNPPFVVGEPDFLAWYERWLNELLAGYDVTWFGLGPAGDARTFLATLERSTDDAARVEAVRALIRIPQPDAELRARIVALTRDRQTLVRTCALFAIEDHPIAEGLAAAVEALDDPEPKVRNAGLRAVAVLGAAQHAARMLELAIADPDDNVALSAVIGLDKQGLLPRENRLRIVAESPHHGARSQAAWKLKWSSDDEALLRRLLEDPFTQLRAAAIGAIRTLKLTGAAPALLARLAREDDVGTATALIKALGELGDRSATDALLERARTGDDFVRLAVLEALARQGDERVAPLAEELLRVRRRPVREHRNGSMSHAFSIATLAREQLEKSPSERLRALVRDD